MQMIDLKYYSLAGFSYIGIKNNSDQGSFGERYFSEKKVSFSEKKRERERERIRHIFKIFHAKYKFLTDF